MPRLKDFMEAGLQGISKRIDTRRLFEEYARGEERTLVLKVRYPKGQGEEFGFFVDTRSWQVGVTESYAIPQPTVKVTIGEELMWLLASRQQTLFSAYYQNYPIEVEGDYVLRDILVLDKVLELIYDCLLAEGVDLARILVPK